MTPAAIRAFAEIAVSGIDTEPWDLYKELRDRWPVVELGGRIFTFRYAESSKVLASSDFATDHPFRASRHVFGRTILELAGPVHDAVRKIIGEPLRSSELDQFEAHVIRPIVEEVIEGVHGRDEFDVWTAIATVVPARVVCALLGIPAKHAAWIRSHVVDLSDFIDSGRLPLPRAIGSASTLRNLLGNSLFGVERPFGPVGRALREAADDQLISMTTAINNALFLLMSGTVTTECALAAAIAMVFGGDRSLADAVRSDLDVDEIARLEPPVRFTPRFASVATELGDICVPRGSLVFACIASANRDEDVFDFPDNYVPRRPARSLTFGRGVHNCVGMLLARREIDVVLQAVRDGGVCVVHDTQWPQGSWAFRRPAAVRATMS